MKFSKIIRWSGLASAVGGALWTTLFLLKLSDEFVEFIGPYNNFLTLIPLVLFLAGLVGLYAVLKTSSKHLEPTRFLWSFLRVTGLVLAFGGLAAAIVGSIKFRSAPDDLVQQTTVWFNIYLVGTGVLSIGMALLGVAIVRTRTLPRWNGAPLAIGLLGILWIPSYIVVTFLVPTDFFDGLTTVLRAAFGAGWMALGYVLWTVPFVWLEQRMERLSRWMSRLAFFDILENLGKLAILVAVILFLVQLDDREKQKHYEAWQVITSAQGQSGTGGRIEAIQELNDDGQSLVGLSAEGAFLERIDLEGANLSSAKLQEADLVGANLSNTRMWRADLDDAYLGPYPAESGNEKVVASLAGADLSEAYLRGTFLAEAQMQEVVLNDSKMDRANLSGANLQGAQLENAVLMAANLSSTANEDEKRTVLREAVLNNANLHGAKLDNADLRGAEFNGAFLATAVLSEADLRGAEFIGADLNRASLAGADLQDADFEGALLDGADLRNGTDLRGVKNLTQIQIEFTLGDETTQLPENLERPSTWDEASTNIPREGEITSGDYVSEEFLMPFSFSTEGGWRVAYPEVDNHLTIVNGEEYLEFSFIQEVYDPKQPALERIAPAPEDMVGWFQSHPYLEIADTAPVKIGNAFGVQFDVSIPSAPDDYPTTCDNPCVPLFPLSDGGQYRYFEDTSEVAQHRVFVLEFSGDPVVIATNPSSAGKSRQFLESMNWGGWTTNLSPGSHSTDEKPVPERFRVPFSFSVEEGWQETTSSPDYFALTPGVQEDLTSLNFISPTQVYDPNAPTMQQVVAAPETAEEMVAWFQNNRYLDAEKPEPVKVGDVNGVAFDATVSTVPIDYPVHDYGCPGPCVPLFWTDGVYHFLEGYRNRVIVLEVDGETVIISIESPASKFEAFLPQAEKVVSTVKWGG